MAERLKRWESPRRQGRNDKGRGGQARQRQLKKRQQHLRQKLKDQNQTKPQEGREPSPLPFLLIESPRLACS
ncbi:hypothetical protein [Synechocystis sp. LKSZ1]|uniref:hypothetical protein n=1 Tax=Synechocystis sp. LKSZ1 TaxID=3144951 RepID=UPI00336BF69A